MAKISIIIPVYNVEKYLPTCLDSVLAQTFPDWEAICINDGSLDNCGRILNDYAEKDDRIKVITQQNQGLSMARNNGLKIASGEYIYFLDSDDFIHPQLLEICYTISEKEKAQMICFSTAKEKRGETSLLTQYDINNIFYKKTDAPLFYQKKRGKFRISVNVWTKFYKRDLIKNIAFISGIHFEDYPHTYAVLSKHPKTILLNIPLHHYMINPTSISNSAFTTKQIKDYHTGLNFVIETYCHLPEKEKQFVRTHLFPSMLKQQLNRILSLPKEKQTELYLAFAEELRDFKEKGWLKLRGHRITRYWKYKKIMKGKK